MPTLAEVLANTDQPQAVAQADNATPGTAGLAPLFNYWERYYNLNPGLLQAINLTETGGTGRWDLTSPKGAQGGMQFMPQTARALGVNDPTDPTQAIPAAGAGLAQLLSAYERKVGVSPQALTMALKAYNGGTNPARWNNPETARYPGVVYDYYQKLNQPGSLAALMGQIETPPPT